MLSDKDMKKERRGTNAIKICKSDAAELCAIKWFDNWAISVLITYQAVEPTSMTVCHLILVEVAYIAKKKKGPAAPNKS